MSNSKRGIWYWVSAWWPVAVGIAVIMMESTEYMGSEYTSGPLRWLFEAIFGPIGSAQWNIVHHYVRKSGHFLGYGAIGLTWLRAWWMTLPDSSFLPDALLALLGTALVASWDEWHQTFLPNRTGSAWDMLLDCCGAITLQFVVYMYFRLMRPKRLARAA
jgi:VanZ family protein